MSHIYSEQVKHIILLFGIYYFVKWITHQNCLFLYLLIFVIFHVYYRNCLRRIARNDDHEFSRESIVNLMEKFVKTVNVMDETILVPCRLMDRSVSSTLITYSNVWHLFNLTDICSSHKYVIHIRNFFCFNFWRFYDTKHLRPNYPPGQYLNLSSV